MSAFELQMRVNYLGNVHSVKAALPGMLQRRAGRVVLVTSSLAILGFAGGRASRKRKLGVHQLGLVPALCLMAGAAGVAGSE